MRSRLCASAWGCMLFAERARSPSCAVSSLKDGGAVSGGAGAATSPVDIVGRSRTAADISRCKFEAPRAWRAVGAKPNRFQQINRPNSRGATTRPSPCSSRSPTRSHPRTLMDRFSGEEGAPPGTDLPLPACSQPPGTLPTQAQAFSSRVTHIPQQPWVMAPSSLRPCSSHACCMHASAPCVQESLWPACSVPGAGGQPPCLCGGSRGRPRAGPGGFPC